MGHKEFSSTDCKNGAIRTGKDMCAFKLGKNDKSFEHPKLEHNNTSLVLHQMSSHQGSAQGEEHGGAQVFRKKMALH